MEWCKLYANLPALPRVQAAEAEAPGAAWLIVQGYCYLTLAESDGLIPYTQVDSFTIVSGDRSGVVAALTKRRIWQPDRVGYLVDPDLWTEDRNLSDSADKRRETDRNRQRKRRERLKAEAEACAMSRDSHTTGAVTTRVTVTGDGAGTSSDDRLPTGTTVKPGTSGANEYAGPGVFAQPPLTRHGDCHVTVSRDNHDPERTEQKDKPPPLPPEPHVPLVVASHQAEEGEESPVPNPTLTVIDGSGTGERETGGQQAGMWPALEPEPGPVGPGHPEFVALVDEVLKERDGTWLRTKVEAALTEALAEGRPWHRLGPAMLAVASTPGYHSPGRVKSDGPHWQAGPPRRSDPPRPRTRWCGSCERPETHERLRHDGSGEWEPCPDCHPTAAKEAAS